MDEVFGSENFISIITFKKTGGQSSVNIPSVSDYIIFYGKKKEQSKFRQIYVTKNPGEEGATNLSGLKKKTAIGVL